MEVMRLLALLLALSMPVWATDAANFQRSVSVCGNGSGYRKTEFPDGVCSPPNVYFTGSFATAGAIETGASPSDGFTIESLPITQSACEFTTLSAGGSTAALDFRVVASGTAVGADTVTARAGSNFALGTIYYTKEYEEINDGTCPDTATDKPRGNFTLANVAHRIDWDVENWVGFSIYLPSDFNHEIATTGNQRSNQIFTIYSNAGDSTFMQILLWRETGDTYTHWWLQTWTDDTSLNESADSKEVIPLGDVVADADLGKWTDFVIRYRMNPWETGVTCNPSTGVGTGCTLVTGSRNTSYTGGTGILQVWKASGEYTSGFNRAMTLLVDRTSVPVGLVPHANTTTAKVQHSFRQYKYAWKKTSTNSTAPIAMGFDEIRMGQATLHGTEYSDVHPGGQDAP